MVPVSSKFVKGHICASFLVASVAYVGTLFLGRKQRRERERVRENKSSTLWFTSNNPSSLLHCGLELLLVVMGCCWEVGSLTLNLPVSRLWGHQSGSFKSTVKSSGEWMKTQRKPLFLMPWVTPIVYETNFLLLGTCVVSSQLSSLRKAFWKRKSLIEVAMFGR